MLNKKTALIIIDCQKDFFEDGLLTIKDSLSLVPKINKLIEENVSKKNLIIASKDFHPLNHCSFASSHENKNPLDQVVINNVSHTLWPDHCVQNSLGADFIDGLNTKHFNYVLKKGIDANIEAYSIFYDVFGDESTKIDQILKENKITDLLFCGVALDFCVGISALDAIKNNYKVTVDLNATGGIGKHEMKKMIKKMKKNNISLLNG